MGAEGGDKYKYADPEEGIAEVEVEAEAEVEAGPETVTGLGVGVSTARPSEVWVDGVWVAVGGPEADAKFAALAEGYVRAGHRDYVDAVAMLAGQTMAQGVFNPDLMYVYPDEE